MILLKKENKNDIKTIEGQNAQIEGANITDFELKGDTYQQTYTGKNKFSTNFIISNTNITIKNIEKNNFSFKNRWADLFISESNTQKIFKADTTYTLSCKFKIVSRPSSFSPNNNNRILGLYNGSTMVDMMVATQKTTGELNTWYEYSKTFKIPSNLENFYILVYNFKDGENVSSGEIEISELQIEVGDTFTEYEPYVGGMPSPNPDYPQEIVSVTGLQNVEVCGKNLFDITTYPMEQGNFSYINNFESSNVRIIRSPFIPILPNTTYTISLNENIGELGILYKQKGNSTLIIGFASNINDNKYYTFTTPENAYYMRFRFGNATFPKTYTNNYDIQLEKGSVATEYEPYKGNTYEVNLGKNLCNNALFVASSGATINSYTDNSISVTFVGTYKAATQFIDISNSIYTFSIGNISNNKGRMEVYLYNNGEQVGTKQNVTANQTYTIDNTSGLGDQIRLTLSNSDLTQTNEIIFNNIQLEVGTQSTSFSPYFTPIELNEIGDYQDRIYKDNDKWYVEKQIGKTIITESNKNIIESFDTQNNHNRILINKSNLGWQTSWLSGVAILNKYKEITSASAVDTGCFGTNFTQNALTIWNDNFTDLTTAQNLLIGTEILIALATPTYTEITNEELINQLEEISKAKLLSGENNIMITASDLVGTFKISYSNWYKFEKILRSGYNIKEDYDRITQKFINGRRKQILSDYEDCIIKLSLGTFDLETTVEYLKMLEDGEYEYYSFNDHDYKRADFLLEERPEIIVANSLKEDEAEIEDFEVTLLKAGE